MNLTPSQIAHYHDHGYVVIPQVFDSDTVRRMVIHYMRMNELKVAPSVFGGDPDNQSDPLNQYPRPIQMHHWDHFTRAWAYDAKVWAIVRQLISDEPVLNQTMLYYKPPGARGQGLHQDQQYITIDPLIGAWVALDDADVANGQMVLAPGSHKLGMLPVEKADLSKSFTGGQTKMPEGASVIGVDMKAGDGLFFAGKTVHGSYPNTTRDRFRRSFICHYVGEHAKSFTPPTGTHMSHLRAAG